MMKNSDEIGSLEAPNVISFQVFRSAKKVEAFEEILLPDGTVITSEQRQRIAKAMVLETALEVKARISSCNDH